MWQNWKAGFVLKVGLPGGEISKGQALCFRILYILQHPDPGINF